MKGSNENTTSSQHVVFFIRLHGDNHTSIFTKPFRNILLITSD